MAPAAMTLLAALLLLPLMDASSGSLLLLQDPPQTDMDMATRRSLQQQQGKLDCPAKCKDRCAKNWKNEMCNDKCNVCCNRCNCVPPGTGQDTRHLCPCYDTMLNPHNGKPKCP